MILMYLRITIFFAGYPGDDSRNNTRTGSSASLVNQGTIVRSGRMPSESRHPSPLSTFSRALSIQARPEPTRHLPGYSSPDLSCCGMIQEILQEALFPFDHFSDWSPDLLSVFDSSGFGAFQKDLMSAVRSISIYTSGRGQNVERSHQSRYR